MLFKKPKWGLLLLAIWLIVYGAVQLLSLSFAHLGLIQGGLAVVAGILLLLDR
jgi:hypothetical protein